MRFFEKFETTVRERAEVTRAGSKISAMNENDLKRLLDANAAETRAHFEKKLDSSVAEMRRHFDVTAERLENKFQIIAETAAQFDDKFDRKIDDLEERMERGFVETQAMIKFSHAELDRRVRALESGLADLQARVDRLEGSTH